MSIVAADTTIGVYAAGSKSYKYNSGGAKTSVWNSNSPFNFINSDGGPINNEESNWLGNQSGCSVTEGPGSVLEITPDPSGEDPSNQDFANVITGTIAYVDFASTYDSGYYFVTRRDNLGTITVTLDGTTYISNTSCDIRIGGAINSIVSTQVGGTMVDIANAATQNRIVLIKDDETLADNLTFTSGGGTAVTLLHFFGVDTDWVRIVPTRTIANGGAIANSLLDTSIMPDITLNANVELHFDVNYVHVDGLFVHGNTDTHLVGSSGADFQQYTNCAFDNASTGDNAKALRGDVNTYVENCDLIASGASGDTQCFNGDGPSVVINCRLIQSSSDTLASLGIQSDQGFILNCLFDTVQGIAIKWIGTSNLIPQVVANCTFWECGVEVQYPNAAHTIPAVFSNNLSSGNDIAVIDNLAANDRLFFGYYNRIIDFDTAKYPSDIVGDVGFQDITGAGTDFVSTGNKNFNLQIISPASRSGSLGNNIGALPTVEEKDLTIINTIIIGEGIGVGIENTNNLTLFELSNLTIYNFDNGVSFNKLLDIGDSSYLINNCIFHTCIQTDNPSMVDGYGIYSEFTSGGGIVSTLNMVNNATYNCTNGLHNLDDNPDNGTITCTDDPFGNISAGDYSLNDAPNGGNLLRNAGASPAYNWD